jgi:histidine ammonia-lyase
MYVVSEKIIIAEAPVRWQDVVAVARHGAKLELAPSAWARIDNAQAIVQRIVSSGDRAYGVNTGLGALCNVSAGRTTQPAVAQHLAQPCLWRG